MGKWNYRRRWTPKNYYRDQRIPSPPTYYDTEFKLRGAWKNVDLPWEERFCISVGLPWEKVINTKKYMYCHDSVVKWNDMAGEVTFCDAKKRFWATINGLPSDVPQPDPDMYIDEIDWNPRIDPELVKELDHAYFNPDEAEKDENFDTTKKNGDNLAPGCILGLDDKNPRNGDNPWERGNTHDRELNDIAWGCSADKSSERHIAWGGGGSSSWQKDMTWGGGASNSWHQNQRPVQGVNNSSKNTWSCGGRNVGLEKETGWGRNRNSCGLNGWESGQEFRNAAYVNTSQATQPSGAPKSRQWEERRDTSFSRGQWHAQYHVPNNLGHQGHNGSGWESNVGGRKREGSGQYASSYKSARVQSDDYGGGNLWRRQKKHNRVGFTCD